MASILWKLGCEVVTVRLADGWTDCLPKGDLADFSEAHDSKDAADLRGRLGDIVSEFGRTMSDDESPEEHDERTEELDEPRFTGITTSEFLSNAYSVNYLIEGVLMQRQPGGIFGGKKQLKTNISIDRGLSLATGSPFLDRFTVPGPVCVGLMSR